MRSKIEIDRIIVNTPITLSELFITATCSEVISMAGECKNGATLVGSNKLKVWAYLPNFLRIERDWSCIQHFRLSRGTLFKNLVRLSAVGVYLITGESAVIVFSGLGGYCKKRWIRSAVMSRWLNENP